MRKFSLKSKIALWSLLIFLLFATSIAVITINYFQYAFQQSIGEHQYSLVKQVASEFDSKIILAQQSLVALASKITPEMIYDKGKAQNFLDSRVVSFTMFNNGLNLFSAKGILLVEAPDANSALIGKDFSEREYIKHTIATQKPYISPPFISVHSNRHPLVMFTYPVFGEDGELLAILTGSMDLLKPNYLGSLVDAKIGESGYMYLATTGNLIVIHPDTNMIMKELTVENPLFNHAKLGFEGSGRTVNYKGVPVLSSFKRLSTTNWILVASIPVAEAFAPVSTAVMSALFIIAIGALLIALIYWLVMGYLISPLDQVIKTIKSADISDITNLGSVAVSTRDEIMELTVAFNNLMNQVAQDSAARKQVEGELHRLNEELEQRVLQRTVELNEMNQELESFSYSISHDLRAPLLRITGFAEILEGACSNKLSEEELHCVERLKASCFTMKELIDALLNLSKMGRHIINLETVNLSSMANDIVTSLKDSDPTRNVEISIQEGLEARGDRALLKSLLENLLGNAWKYSSKEEVARIKFGMRDDHGKQIYFVNDNGAGFDMKYSESLFSPFRRLHPEKEFEGVGIGLATVQRIVRRHEGTVWAEAVKGEGATFYFTLGDTPR